MNRNPGGVRCSSCGELRVFCFRTGTERPVCHGCIRFALRIPIITTLGDLFDKLGGR